jgi:hypothetical protein
MRKFRHYVLGRHTTIVTDHRALVYLDTVKDTTGQLHRWAIELQEYDYTVQYRPGKDNANADTLSRTPFDRVDTDALTDAAIAALTISICGFDREDASTEDTRDTAEQVAYINSLQIGTTAATQADQPTMPQDAPATTDERAVTPTTTTSTELPVSITTVRTRSSWPTTSAFARAQR